MLSEIDQKRKYKYWLFSFVVYRLIMTREWKVSKVGKSLTLERERDRGSKKRHTVDNRGKDQRP